MTFAPDMDSESLGLNVIVQGICLTARWMSARTL